MRVNMHEAKTTLSELVAAAESGEEVIIARNGTPAARLRAPRRLSAVLAAITSIPSTGP
jgi:antitoxin (DNA-binding transcriptional repressor) of toxin-antitoxin stability system